MASGDGDLGELFALGAVLVHVARGRKGVHAHRIARFVGGLVGEDLGARDEAAATGALGAPVGYEGDLAEPRIYGRCRVEQVRDERAATHVGRVAVAGPYAEVLPDGEGGHVVVGRGRKEAVHVLFF